MKVTKMMERTQNVAKTGSLRIGGQGFVRQHVGKSKVASSPLTSQGPTSGKKGYITPAFSGVPRAPNKTRNELFTLAFSGAYKCLRNCYATHVFPGSVEEGTKSEAATSPLPSQVPTIVQNRNPCVLGGPLRRGQNQKWEHHPFVLTDQKWVEALRNCFVPAGPLKRGQNQKCLHHPCLLGSPKLLRIAT